MIRVLHGDISNRGAETVALRCVGTLTTYLDTSFKDKVLNALSGHKRVVVNEDVKSLVEYIYMSTDMRVVLVIFEDEYSDYLMDAIKNVPYSEIARVKRPSFISSKLNTGVISYYVDSDDKTRSLVNSQWTMPVNKIGRILRIKGRR